LCFGGLTALVVLNSEASKLDTLFSLWPLALLLSLGAGAFPPAILALLADISRQEAGGTTFGLYSLVLGIGFVFGPLAGGLALGYGGLPGFSVFVVLLVTVAAAGALRIRES
jgi:MFS family permease